MACIRQMHAISKPTFSILISTKMAKNNEALKINNLSRTVSTSSQFLYEQKVIKVTFINEDGYRIEVKGKVGDSMMQVALKNSIYPPYEVCGGDLKCGSCNFTFPRKDYDRLPEPSHAELMHLNWHRYPHWSRMGCQIKMTKALYGIEIRVSNSREKLITREEKMHLLLRNIPLGQLLCEQKKLKVTFIKENGVKIEAKGKVGDSMIEIASKNTIFRRAGLCYKYSSMSCFGCSFIFTKQDYDQLPEPSYDEKDYLYDHFIEMSRLGCEVKITEELDGIQVRVPPKF